MSISELAKKTAQAIYDAERVIALTGAGISVDSGIPDFRSAGGLWSRFDPMEYAHIDSFRSNPEKIWNMLKEMQEMMENAGPNPGHVGLAKLEELGRMHAIITQNVDDLHQRAGSTKVIEFHGNNKNLVCLDCGNRYDKNSVSKEVFPPRCECDTILKPDVVFFGEAIPQDAHIEAYKEASICNVLLVVGTSAVVAPCSNIPVMAKQSGATVIEINLEETGLTNYISDFLIKASSSEVMPLIAEEVESLTNNPPRS